MEQRPSQVGDALVKRMVALSSVTPRAAVELVVVGRCGWGKCPTVFFQPYGGAVKEHEVSHAMGRDEAGAQLALSCSKEMASCRSLSSTHWMAIPPRVIQCCSLRVPRRFSKKGTVSPNPSIERTFQRPLRPLWPAAHVER